MSNTDETQTPSSRQPAYIAYSIRERKGAKAIFTRIGAAWPHKDGGGFNIELAALPIDGKIALRIPTEKKE
jgi:hypothetical protein